MRAGSLRHIVVLSRRGASRNDYGESDASWTPIATRRASIEPITGEEYFSQGAEDTKVTTKIRLRYDSALSGVKPSDRVEHGSVMYDIQSVINPSESNRELTLMCERSG